MQATPGRHQESPDPVSALLHAIGLFVSHRVEDALRVLDRSEVVLEEWVETVAETGHEVADAVIVTERKLVNWIRLLVLLLWLRAKLVVQSIWLAVVWLLFTMPPAVAGLVRRFFTGEVIPTSQFLVEVPLGLGSAAITDLFVRVPIWSVTEGPAVLVQVARWSLTQALVLTVAAFDRVQGLVQRLIDGALLIYDSIYGGLRWLVVAAFFHFAPWLFDLAISLGDNLISFVHSAILLALAFRLWLWHALLSLPRIAMSIATWVVELIANVLDAGYRLSREVVIAVYASAVSLVNWLVAFLRQLPHVLIALLTGFWTRLLDIVQQLLHTLMTLVTGFWNSLLVFVQQLPHLLMALLTGFWTRLLDVVFWLPRVLVALLTAFWDWLPGFLSALGDTAYAILDATGQAIFWITRGVVTVVERLATETWNLLWLLLVTLPLRLAEWAWHCLVSLFRFLFIELPRFACNALVYLVTELPQQIASTTITVVKEIGRLLNSTLQQLMRPVSTLLTWVLAVAIAPFYLIWHLFEPRGRGGPGRPSAGVRS